MGLLSSVMSCCVVYHVIRAIRGTDESVFAEGAGVGGRNRVGYWGDNNWEENTGNTNQKVGGEATDLIDSNDHLAVACIEWSLERRLGPGGEREERAGGRDRQPPLQRA